MKMKEIPEIVKEMKKKFGLAFLYEANSHLKVIEAAQILRSGIRTKERELELAESNLETVKRNLEVYMDEHNLTEADLR